MWDANGNLTSKSIGSQGTYYRWSANNRLIEVKQGQSEATATTVARYSYDANGNRVQKSEPGQDGQPDKVTSCLTDNTFAHAQVVQESTPQGSATESTRYVWGANLIAQSKGGQDAFHHADGLGSVKALTDASGNATDSYAYDAFGSVENKMETTANGYRYTGEYFDDAIGLQYNRARWYEKTTGNLISIDPWSGRPTQPLSLNKYIYAHADPINNKDPSGAMALGLVSALGDLGSQYTAQLINIGVNSARARQLAAKMCAIGAVLAKPYNQLVRKLPKNFQAHHIFQDATLATSAFQYSRYTALAIPLLGGSFMSGSPHDLSNRWQQMNNSGSKQSFQQARTIVYGALIAAGCRKSDATEMILAAENNFKLRKVGLGF